jgi:hypothetical protein
LGTRDLSGKKKNKVDGREAVKDCRRKTIKEDTKDYN